MPLSPRRFYSFGPFRLDPVEGVLSRDGLPIALTPKAAETLLALVERHGRLVTKEELLRVVWPDAFVEDNNLAQNISMLRRALGDTAGRPRFIETVPRRGYRFVAAVEEQSEGERSTPVPVGAPEAQPAAGSGRLLQRATIGALLAVVSVALVLLANSWGRERTSSSFARPEGERRPADGFTRIAVLPFVNLGSPDAQSFVAGINEELTSHLAGLRRLAVTSSTTTAQYDRRGKSLRRVGEDLGVQYVVEGSVRWAKAPEGVHVRITPKLIRVADDRVVWTHQYDAALSDLFAVQTDIAYRITGALEIVLETGERRGVEARSTANPDAYLAYLRGIAAYQQGATDTSNQRRARADLEQAVALDPEFAVAWSWLARVYAWQYTTGAERRPEVRDAARRAAQRAIALHSGFPEARLGLAQMLLIDQEHEAALRELDVVRRALPHAPEPLRMIANIEQGRSRWIDAGRAYREAFDLDPASTSDLIAVHHLHLREYTEARRFIQVAKAANRTTVAVPEAWTYFSETGDIAAARRVLETALAARSPADARVRGLLAVLEWFDGRHERALSLIDGMDSSGGWLPAAFRYPAALAAAQVFESMGRRTEAVTKYVAATAELERRLRVAPDDYQVHAALGLAAAGLGRASQAVRHGTRAVELLPVLRDGVQGPVYLYVLAQIHARLGEHAAAFEVLDRMFSVPGFYNETWVRRDPAFASLRRDPAFDAHLRRWSLQRGDALLKTGWP